VERRSATKRKRAEETSVQSYTFEDLMAVGGFTEPTWEDKLGVKGWGLALLTDEDGAIKELQQFKNLITNKGDQYYAERAAGIGSPPGQVTGMQLGTGGGTAAAKTGAGAAIVTLTASSLVAIDGGFPTSNGLQSGAVACRIQWKTTWPAGTATANGINEVALVNQATGTQTAAPASATIARAVLGTTVNKAAGDTLAITWNNDLLGA